MDSVISSTVRYFADLCIPLTDNDLFDLFKTVTGKHPITFQMKVHFNGNRPSFHWRATRYPEAEQVVN